MSYTLSPEALNKLSQLMTDYYERELEGGYRAAFDTMARSRMGLVTAKIDLAKDTVASIRAKSVDKFTTTFKAKLMSELRIQTGNRTDLITLGTDVGVKLLKVGFSKIPVPLVGTVLNQVVDLAHGKAKEELHQRSINEADATLAKRTGVTQQTMSINDSDAAEHAENAISLYKEIAKYAASLPQSISTFEEAIVFPGVVWKTQRAASSLNVNLRQLIVYLSAMEERLATVQQLSRDGIAKVRTEMGGVVTNVLNKAWDDGWNKGKADVQVSKYAALANPVLGSSPEPGGASQLAVYVAHAFSQGYYQAGNHGPQRLRSNAVTERPLPEQRPRSNAMVGGHRR